MTAPHKAGAEAAAAYAAAAARLRRLIEAACRWMNYVAGWALNAVTEQRDLADILRNTGQRVIGAADLILQTTQPTPTITDTALDALEGDIRVKTDPTRWEAVSVTPAGTPEPAPTSVPFVSAGVAR